MDKKKLLRIILTAILLVVAVVVEKTMGLEVWQLLLVYLVPFLLIGYDVIGEAVEGIMKGEIFDEDFLMCIATIGALLIGFLPGAETEFPEAVFVMLFFQLGELFEDYAEDNSRKSISHLMDIRPDTANVLRNGQLTVVKPEEVGIGETIVVRPGEKMPLDGKVTEGTTSLNTVALTGESMPRPVAVGDDVVSGCVNLSGVIKVRVEKTYGESTVSKILDLVENAGENKSKSETFIAKFAHVYTPIVVCIALLLAFIPPFFGNSYMEALPVWLNRALTFLVVSCPCALVISVPLTFFAGIGGASKRGILIKGSNYMDTLANTGTVVFDKTGTLTKGKFEVEAIHPNNFNEKELLHLAAHVERFSTHPIAMSLKTAFGNEDDGCSVTNVKELAGNGVTATVNGKTVHVGNSRLMDAIGAEWHQCHKAGTIVHVAVDGVYVGHIVVADIIKEDSQKAIGSLKELGVKKTVMLTGDRREVGELVAQKLRIDECHSELLPADKVSIMENILKAETDKEKTVFVGDGINDAPVLALADVGIAMGALGSDAAIEAADVVLMDDKPSKIATAIAIARRTIGIAMQNVVFAIAVKLLVLFLASFGIATMWMAVFADVGVTVIAVLNAMRALNTKQVDK
ncbi:heavy metal translocating P-type ATPase [Prevotella sp.]|uniref:heavy metal translocating P-type ATPase n=1 Tax=Prevotella sp. TaxID=59823 RepID=UPI0025D315C0|nr:heavy metal translocating P-type ATPase [Prevotella sp.]